VCARHAEAYRHDRNLMVLGSEPHVDCSRIVGYVDHDVYFFSGAIWNQREEEMKCNECNHESENVNPTQLRDKCDRLLGLMQCLVFVVDHPDIKSYIFQPHHLMMTIEDGIREIELKLRDL